MKKVLQTVLSIMLGVCILFSVAMPVYADAETTYYVTASQWVNVRSGPGTSYKVVGRAYRSQKVEVTQVKNGWKKTEKGWISGKYLSTKKPSSNYLRTVSGVRVTAYCAGSCCNGSWSSGSSTQTASGTRLYNKSSYANKYCAATPSVGKLGETIQMTISGKTYKLKIVDRLGSSSGKAVDIFMPSHSQCNKFGNKKNVTAKIYK